MKNIKYGLIVLGVIAVAVIVTSGIKNYDLKENKKNIEDYESYKTFNHLSKEIISNAEESEAMIELEKEYTPEYMLEISDSVAIVSIISIDGADTEISQAVGNTYGTLVINNVLYGDLERGDKISYLKSGGIMTLEDYEKNQLPAAREKREELRKEAGIDASKVYVNFHYENDSDIEEGKMYLCYLKYLEKFDRYEIIGLGDGFREINVSKSNTVTSRALSISNDEYRIKNNRTGKFESLDEYINKYLS